MSTNNYYYYYLAYPITRLRITHTIPGIVSIHVTVATEETGKLVVSPEHVSALMRLFSQIEPDDSRCPIYTYCGDVSRGCVVVENVRGLDPNLQLISEYGELLTVAEIRALDGAGKEGRQR